MKKPGVFLNINLHKNHKLCKEKGHKQWKYSCVQILSVIKSGSLII